MSRSGYSEGCDGWELICWRGAVASAIRGTRGQALLREMRDALDAMETKELIYGELEAEGQHCALGVVGAKRGMDLAKIDSYDPFSVGEAFGIARALAAEISFINDDGYGWRSTPAQRWANVRAWVESQIR